MPSPPDRRRIQGILVSCERKSWRLAQDGLLEQLHGAAGVVGDGEHLVELDVGVHAVALHDAVPPRTAVEGLGVLQGVPLIDAAGPSALAPDEVLADEPLGVAKARRDLVEVGAARRVDDVRWELVANGGGDHEPGLPGNGVVAERYSAPGLIS